MTDESEIASLRAQLTEAHARIARQRDFLAQLVHEFRSPLNAIAGFAEIMAEGHFGPLGNPRYVDYARDIHTAAIHLSELVVDTLDVARFSSGQYALEEEVCDLAAVLTIAAATVRGLAERNRQNLVLDLPEHLSVFADPRALRQVAINLLSNALKFTPAQGTICLAARVAGDGMPGFGVSDNGAGMDSATLARATQLYAVSGQGMRGEKGTGLGLSIVRLLTELHGGKLAVDSVAGAGTDIWVSLPAWRARSGPPPVHPWENVA
jgi:two-component system, cell cycle sensor histidine kinase DivJ